MLLQSILALSVLFFYIVCCSIKSKVDEKCSNFQKSFSTKMMKINDGSNEESSDLKEKFLQLNILVKTKDFIVNKYNFTNILYCLCNVIVCILLLFNTLFIILNLEFVQIYSFIIILLNVLTAIYWIFFWFKFKSSAKEYNFW